MAPSAVTLLSRRSRHRSTPASRSVSLRVRSGPASRCRYTRSLILPAVQSCKLTLWSSRKQFCCTVLSERFWAPCSFGGCVGGVVGERVGNSYSLSEGVVGGGRDPGASADLHVAAAVITNFPPVHLSVMIPPPPPYPPPHAPPLPSSASSPRLRLPARLEHLGKSALCGVPQYYT